MASSRLDNQAVEKHRALETLAQKGWVTLSKFATIIGVSYPTAQRWLQDGKVSATRVGGTWRVYTDEVEKHLTGESPDDFFRKKVRKEQTAEDQRADELLDRPDEE